MHPVHRTRGRTTRACAVSCHALVQGWPTESRKYCCRTLDINLGGVFSVMAAAWPVLVRQGYGRVVVTCSPAMYGSGVEAYAASKTGLIGLASSLQVRATTST